MRQTSPGRDRDRVWGAHVHGAEGWNRVNNSGLRRPVGASLKLREHGVFPEDVWRSARGSRPNVLLYRRFTLGLVDHSYAFEPPDAHVERIAARVRAELLSLVALSPLFLRAPVSTELAESDASDTWGAVVNTQNGARTANELWRLRDLRARSYVRCETGVGGNDGARLEPG